MARSFSKFLFRAAKKISRLQRAALRAAMPPKSGKRAAVRKPAARTARSRSEADAPALGKGRWEATRHFVDAAGRRISFARYTPEGAPPAGMPLVVMLHGCRQSAAEFARGSRMNAWADAGGFMVLYPQQSMARQVQRCWRWFLPDEAHGGGEADLLAALIRAEVERHRLDPERVYVAGLSAGAGMAALLALRHPALIAAVGLHSGPVAGDARNAAAGLQLMRRGSVKSLPEVLRNVAAPEVFRLGMPAIILHGQLDPFVAPRNARQLAEQFRIVNDVHPQEMPADRVLGLGTVNSYRRLDMLRGRKAVVSLCEVTRLEHAWSGGDPTVKYHAGHGPDASALCWRFFQGHRRKLVPGAGAGP